MCGTASKKISNPFKGERRYHIGLTRLVLTQRIHLPEDQQFGRQLIAEIMPPLSGVEVKNHILLYFSG